MDACKLASIWCITVFCLACCIMFYQYGEKSIKDEAVENNHATYNQGKFQWKTNTTISATNEIKL